MIATALQLIMILWSLTLAEIARAQSATPQAPEHAAPQWVTPAISAPRVTQHTFDSRAARTKVSYHIYIPAAYERDATARFPVVYWLHGSGGGLAGIPALSRRFDAAIEAGALPPCLLVMVNGLELGMYVDWRDGSAPVETVIVQDLLAHIDTTFRTIATREGRLLDGFSMGGYGAARLGFKFPELFRAVSIMGAGPLQADLTKTPRARKQQAEELLQRVYGGDPEHFRAVSPRRLAEANAQAITRDSLVRIVIGDADETYLNNRAFHDHLESLAIPHEWIVLAGVGHDPDELIRTLGDRHWAFYRAAFGGSQAAGASGSRADIELALTIGDVRRRAIIVNAPPLGTQRAAVIALHGGMGNAEQMRLTSGFDTVAKAGGFMVVYAEGTSFGGDRHAWNTGYLLRRQVGEADDIAYFDALIDRLIAEYGADPARICMTGGSNGGMMCFVYAVARPERLAAAAPVVASMFSFDKVPALPLPILIINGARDEEVPIDGGMSGNPLVKAAQAAPYKPLQEVVRFWVRANRSKPDGTVRVEGSVTTTTYAADAGGAITEFVLDSAGGHGWPGSRTRRGGNTPILAFPGAERVWSFFADKARAATAAAPQPVELLAFPDLVDARRGRKVPIVVHLPGGSGRLPMIVVSHGAGGDSDTHFGQAQALASQGYAVLCVEHIGSNRERLTRGLRLQQNLLDMTRDADEVLTRPRDISFAIDRAAVWNESHPKLRGRLDLERIGVMGHSFGACTTMIACGARPALDWLSPRVEPGQGLGPDLSDPRIRCAVALSPQGAGEPFFIEQSFAGLRVPLLGITGSRDDQLSGVPAENRRKGFALWPAGEHRFVWLANARHNDFTSASGATGRALPSPTREEAQVVTRAATQAFFDLHLKGEAGAARRLTSEGLEPFLRGSIDKVEVLVK
jgi:poly(3-hydroxybutyrate) depolymerase